MADTKDNPIEPQTQELAFLADIWNECAEINLGIIKLKACAYIQRDSARFYTIRASVNGNEIFRKTINVQLPTQCFERSLEGVPVISPFADRAKLCVKSLHVTPQEFQCDVELAVRIIAPIPLGWKTIKVWKVRKRIAQLSKDVEVILDDNDDTKVFLGS